ncbi:hypothetical protein [Dasineura jujubifolia toursvirus 2a]|nr:hypothetical protein [Dasineura jujubifolia toursvirus 2a]
MDSLIIFADEYEGFNRVLHANISQINNKKTTIISGHMLSLFHEPYANFSKIKKILKKHKKEFSKIGPDCIEVDSVLLHKLLMKYGTKEVKEYYAVLPKIFYDFEEKRIFNKIKTLGKSFQ